MLGSLALTIGLVAALLTWVDRPWATFAHAHLHGIRAFIWLTHIVAPIQPIALLGLAVTGIAAALGWRPGRNARLFLACCLSALLAFAFKEELKFLFGRTWPETWIGGNPSWIGDGTFSFNPFHGGRGWASFPSGHMAMITAPMAVLWRWIPRGRWLWGLLIAAVAVGLLGADYHWPSDVVAGTWVGWAAAAGALALLGL